MGSRFRYFILITFTFSGSFGLIYEVLWQRQLSLIFGSTLSSTTAVITAFMGGLAIGSWIFGVLSQTFKHPFKVFALLQIGIGVYCLGMPLYFRIIQSIHLVVYNSLGGSFSLELLRFLMAVVILGIPCVLMGGTLPILSRGLVNQKDYVGKSLSLLYFFNTLGASLGTLTAGFILIRVLGMAMSNSLTAVSSVSLGCLVWLVSRHKEAVQTDVICPNSKTQISGLPKSYLPYLYTFIGASGMGTQIAWVRSLNLVLGSTVYAFSMMLASFLLGISIGSLCVGKYLDKQRSPVRTIGVLAFFVCVFVVLSIALISRLPVVLLFLFPFFHQQFYLWQFCLFLLTLLVVFPSTFFMGSLFPAFGRAYISDVKNVGRQVGQLYLFNTFGGITGAIFSAFILIPNIGTRMTLVFFAAVYLVVAAGLLFYSSEDKRSRLQVVFLVILCLVGYQVVPTWEPALLDSGVYLYASELLNGFDSNREILFEKEGFHSHVSVTELGGVRSLRINGKTDGSDGGDLPTQSLLAVIPLAHAVDPSDALVIGLGTGVTVGSALNFPDLNVSCVEIDDAVIEAATYFNHVSGNPFSDKRFNLIHADARTVLGSGLINYDIVISEPSNPWITGVSNLFTVDYFEAAFERLTPDGVMCQWIHSYYMDTETLMIVFRSFQKAFPYCSLWKGSPGDYLILGSRSNHLPDNGDYSFLFNNPGVKAELNRLDIFNSEDFASYLLLRPEDYRRMTIETGDRLNTDNHPYVEFNAPKSLYHDTVKDNWNAISHYQKNQ
jgi:spermidine synthase